jgi:integrase
VLARALLAIGLPADALCVHGLRHAHCSIMIGNGRSIEEARLALRHADSRTTRSYLHLPSDFAKDAVQSVDDAIRKARVLPAEAAPG